MTVADLGSVTVGAAVPAGPALSAAVDASVGIAAPDVSAQVSAVASFSPSAMLSLTQLLDAANAVVANIQAAIVAGLTPPSLAAQAALGASVQVDLTAKLATLQAQLNLALGLDELFAQAGVRVLTFSGQQKDFGGELATALGPDATNANAVVLLTQSAAAWTAMQGVLKTS